MKIVKKQELTTAEKEAIIKIWNNEYPKSLVHKTISTFDEYLDKLTNKIHFLLVDDREGIQGWSITFERDNAQWFALIIDKTLQGKGQGTILLNKLKEGNAVLNGWVIDTGNVIKENGEVYRSPMNFYLKNGFKIYPAERFESEAMSAVKIQWAI